MVTGLKGLPKIPPLPAHPEGQIKSHTKHYTRTITSCMDGNHWDNNDSTPLEDIKRAKELIKNNTGPSAMLSPILETQRDKWEQLLRREWRKQK